MGERLEPRTFASPILDAALDCVISIDHEGHVLAFNRAAEQAFGYRREEVIGRELAELIIPPQSRARHRRALARCVETKRGRILGRRIQLTAMRADGSEFPVELTVTMVPDSDPPRFVGFVRDISEGMQAQEELHESLARERTARADAEKQRFRSRRLLAQTLGAEERERRRLARALHDGPVQSLLAAQLDLGRAARGDREALTRTEGAVADAVGELRESISDLHPPVLERIGLRAALEELSRVVSGRYGLRVDLQIAVETPGGYDQLVFSLCRELLSNAVRHARANELAVRLWREERDLVLEVEDDGIGLSDTRPEEALREGHIGLASSAERVEALRGSFVVQSGWDRGTLVRAVLPARRQADREAISTTPVPTAPSLLDVRRERRALRP